MRDTGFVALRRRGGNALAKTAPSPAVQQFSCLEKAGGRVEPLGRTPKKNHPVQIVRKMPLAYDNQRAQKKTTQTAISDLRLFVKTISSPLVRPTDPCRHPALSSVCVYLLSESCRGRVQLLLPRAETYAGRCWWVTPSDDAIDELFPKLWRLIPH